MACSRTPFAALTLLLVCGGCGGSPYDLAPATGSVTIDGQPFGHGKVMFAPVSQGSQVEVGKPAFGLLNPDGTFTLSTYAADDGAVIGKHWVTVFREDDGPNGPAPAGVPKFGRVVVPAPVEVTDGANNLRIDLTAEQVRRLGAPN
ncbi:hypothetical protein Pla123a_01390 [Posidoniimonas polymericola]|uniref:Carboxypeptidase regulatory-like domain-containing protein n=1 Tax=Posidoniimonas polymericola TaxID=2528002 RepID=A0A5C5ZDD0_9BACT|nr:hypothetical protein [Posidoniimonas polymericola]TWT85332.1 hypothetical protein Pla123a_01390 [Posidoniimonas polymericola]